ncbi:MAG: hypothetical protein ABII00_17175 [Elusimicrobiota bacterium]
MLQQRRPSLVSGFRPDVATPLRGVFQAAVAVLVIAAAAPLYAQQVFIDSLWVHHKGINCSLNPSKPTQLNCHDGAGNRPLRPQDGNISNNPNIQFDQRVGNNFPDCEFGATYPKGTVSANFCNEKIHLCTKVGWSNTQAGNTAFALDFVSFEIFKFGQGANPLDAQSTPPLRTFFVDNPGQIPAGTDSSGGGIALLSPFCVLWDGSYNIQGEFGKTNGQYGFRATVATNQTGASGNINITQTRAYPGGFTRDADDAFVDEKPILVDVTNVHVVRTTPTVAGELTGVAAEPYNITYRLSKDATMYLTIHQSDTSLLNPVIRTIVPGLPRVGEGTPNGTLQNGDSWNGRWDNGDLGPPGVYLAQLQAFAVDQFGADLSIATTRQIALDTLQITDIRVQPLTGQSTSLAVLSYMLTEPGMVSVDIYPPGTQFINGLNSVNQLPDVCPGTALDQAGVKKDFGARLSGPAPVLPVRHIEEQKEFRKSVISFWDGRDSAGNVMPDGDYVFVIYADLPSQNGFSYRVGCPGGVDTDKRIWSSNARSGYLSVARGLVTISQIGPSSSVIGSSPSVAGLDPFTFSYSLSREANVTLKVFDRTGTRLVRTLVDNQVRPGNFLNKERWIIPTDNDGGWIGSGTYLVQLTAADVFFPAKVSTTTALFPVDLFRITDLATTPLLTGATDVITLSYQLSQPMQAAWKIYPPGTVISGSTATWPPCGELDPSSCAQVTNGGGTAVPLITIKGLRPGRLKITEFWDGRDSNGLFVPDGTYVFTLAAQSTTTPKYFATDQVAGSLTVARGAIVFPVFNITPTFPEMFNSSQTISLPPYEVDYSLTRQSSVTISIITTDINPRVVRTLISGDVRDANLLNREFWDARDDAGNFVQPGFYTVRAVAEDLASVLSSGSTAQQTISVDPLRIYDVAVSPLRADFGTALIAYQVSETMKTAIKIYKPGTTFDANGNPSPPEAGSLVKRFVGVQPARNEVNQAWDGKDETLSIVPDGNYLFKIVGSTDINAIDSISGDLVAGAALAEDLVIAEVPVVRAGSADTRKDFEENTFVYPNPARGPTATFRIYVPKEAVVSLNIYNIAGDLVRGEDFGLLSPTYNDPTGPFEFVWNKTNQAGRRVAHGVYFAVIREEATKGEAVVFQAVKKVLIP